MQRGRKPSRGGKSGGSDRITGVDRVSNLPEGLISRILSYLPAEYAVATCILAKSWRSRWTKLSNFDFNDELWLQSNSVKSEMRRLGYYVPNMSFGKVVDMVLRRAGNQNHAESSSIDRSLQRGLNYGNFEFQLPMALSTCGTLEVLKLRGPFLVIVHHVVCLPKLTLLELDFVKYELVRNNDSDVSLRNLISGCPVLDSLRIHRLHYDGMVVCSVSSPVLKRLEYSHHMCNGNCDKCDENMYFKLEIDTPALEYLALDDGYVLKEITFPRKPVSLNAVVLKFTSPNLTAGLLQTFTGVEFVELSRGITEKLSAGNYKLFATFERLTRLLIIIDDSQLRWLMDLISFCAKLKILDIHKRSFTSSRDTWWKDPNDVPECLPSSLARFPYRGFQGLEDEIALVKFVLRHALVMEMVNIPSPPWEKEKLTSSMASASKNKKPTKKRQKCKDGGGGAEDRISYLHEPILSHILSFVPIVSAVRTSVLAKSWRYRWTNATNFHFDDYLWANLKRDKYRRPKLGLPKISFGEFVDIVLRNQNAEFSINQFHVQINNHKYDPEYPGVWVATAIARNVRVLDLSRPLYYSDLLDLGNHKCVNYKFPLPPALFTCATLEVLKLRGSFLVVVDNVACLPKLTLLDLQYVRYQSIISGNDSVESRSNLISGSPALQSVIIRRRYYDGMPICQVSSPLLKRLEYLHDMVFHCDGDPDPFRFKLEINAPSLEYLCFYVEELVLGDLVFARAPTSLNEVFLKSTHDKRLTFELLQAVNRVKIMTFSLATTYFLSTMLITTKLSASFGRLTKLVIADACCRFNWLMDLIDCCALLKVLDIDIFSHSCCDSDTWKVPVSVPKCLSSSLTQVSYRGFGCGHESQMAFLEFILNHASVMEGSYLTSKVTADLNNHLANQPWQKGSAPLVMISTPKTLLRRRGFGFQRGRKKEKEGDYAQHHDQEGPLGAEDPVLVAKERRRRRGQMAADLIEDENTGMIPDITNAEVEYEDEETFEDYDGIQLEPFNLTKEREEGYFDASGNYVAYINEDEMKDAWLDGVEANKITYASRKVVIEDDDAGDLSPDDIGKIKSRIADALEPDETVLQALRRLKGISNNKKEKMSTETKQIFDQLTEDAMRLMENGYNVYDEIQETFQREAVGSIVMLPLDNGNVPYSFC
ncbi:OLC1v1010405C1 [Oldenlandia corymbosa var. corymbosa]|uniref:OLC1v1010405C1 n=1 Tax=Oldenlandia corymbosa var. corymbosa TaxID=529605 RepID=A0AAV1DRH3_OLDCO|nr:OLC1v1010405C1 [Oldenlandia corymbosa var. corymbosa]